MAKTNRKWVLRSRPEGMPGRDDFELREEPVPPIGDGQFLVRTLYLSCDPAQRAWMSRDTYVPMIPIGDVMHSGATGQVVESKHAGFREGDLVSGMFGWQDYAVSDGRGFMSVTKLPPAVAIPTAMSALGVTGLTAYFGMLDVGNPQAGDGVLVSGAAGATGSIAAQIAKIRGAREVAAHHIMHERRREHGAIAGVRRQQQVAHVVTQAAAKPGAERDAEPHLAASLDFRRQQICERVTQNRFRPAPIELHRVGQHGHELDERAIQKR